MHRPHVGITGLHFEHQGAAPTSLGDAIFHRSTV
jgi:hypothetical protein